MCLSLLMKSHYLAYLPHHGMNPDKLFCPVLNLEFYIRNATYKNPTIGTVCHTLHKGTLNNCHDIVLGHLKCTKTNVMATIIFITFSHSNNHNVCHKLNNYFTFNNTNPFINHMPLTHNMRNPGSTEFMFLYLLTL